MEADTEAYVVMGKMVEEIRALTARIEVLEAEKEHMMTAMADYGFFEGEADEEATTIGAEGDDEVDPYADSVRCTICKQLSHLDNMADPLVQLPDKSWQHERCIFGDEVAACPA